jgi:DNA-binding beta-propeller fold protein YncE
VIDGATDRVISVKVGAYPTALAVDTFRNLIYVANTQGDDLTVIDGWTNATERVKVGSFPDRRESDFEQTLYGTTSGRKRDRSRSSQGNDNQRELRNKIYVADATGNQIVVIEGDRAEQQNSGNGSVPFERSSQPVDQ